MRDCHEVVRELEVEVKLGLVDLSSQKVDWNRGMTV
jgi:hypothetical protein